MIKNDFLDRLFSRDSLYYSIRDNLHWHKRNYKERKQKIMKQLSIGFMIAGFGMLCFCTGLQTSRPLLMAVGFILFAVGAVFVFAYEQRQKEESKKRREQYHRMHETYQAALKRVETSTETDGDIGAEREAKIERLVEMLGKVELKDLDKKKKDRNEN